MTQVGLWREIRQDARDLGISSNRLGKINNVWWIFPQGNGPRNAYSDITSIKANLRSRDLIVIGGVLREQFQAPLDIYDLTFLGAANRPRQSTSGGVPTGGGASWLAPTSPVAVTPLCELRAQGAEFHNIQFAGASDAAAIRLTRSASVDTIDASHASFVNCYFLAGLNGIEDNGGSGGVLVDRCRFQGQTGTALLSLNTGAAIPLSWQVQDSRFQQNLHDIRMSLSFAVIERNKFMIAGAAGHTVINDTFIAVQGGDNMILLNQFNNPEAEIAPATGFTGAASDTWMNYVDNQAALAFGQPA